VRSYRYASHAAVILIAVAISSYGTGTFGLATPPRMGAVDAQAANDGEYGDVAMSRDSTIIKPISIPSSALPNRRPIRYTVSQGDTLDSIARAFNVTMREITWSNPGLRLPLKPGLSLELPPVPGVVVIVGRDDTAESLAAAYGVDETEILGFNDIRASQLKPGLMLVVPVDPRVGPNLSTGLPADPLHPGQLWCPIQGAEIVQKFGPTSFAVEPPYAGYLHFHTGIDLIAFYGTPIFAAAGGRVTAVGYAAYYGLRVEITDSYGLVEVYAHMSDTALTLGQSVQQGQEVGRVGSTGLSLGPHLHLQLEVGGVATDPGQPIGC
jgi:murein DD-endopeptidase MepM/ murein hydrolase activator NlpD